jgi:3-oxoacyl-[acyl-carrier protein] reductase
MDLGIAGRVALVTAASKGLGRAAALALAQEGVKVVICSRGADALAQAEADLTAAAAATGNGGQVHTIAGDITEATAPDRMVEETIAHFGGLDILVANAGGPPPGRALEVEDGVLLDAINDNLLTTVRLVRAVLPPMRAAGWGRVCAITSYVIKQPSPTLVASNVARTGLWAWAKTGAADLAGDGITLNLACPGVHMTDRMAELGGVRAGTPTGGVDDFGRIVAFLCSEPAAFITGVALNVDGGATVGLL